VTDRGGPVGHVFSTSVELAFVASHAVKLPNGELEPVHDHRWRVVVTFAAPALDDRDMVVDFCDVSARLSALLSSWEGRRLNALAAFAGTTPTAERVAERIFAAMSGAASPPARLTEVRVEEAPGCVACFRADAQAPGPRGGGNDARSSL
jgi:6-pyruvoyltetrahydropterin/6-carboxytetrahydropterin synthase